MATSLCKGVGSDDSFTEGLTTKKIRFRDKTKGLDRDLLVDRPIILSVSWKDLLVGNSNPDSRRLVAPFGANADEDLALHNHRKETLTGGSQGEGFNLGKLAREGHGGQIGKFNALGYKGATGSSGQLEKLGRVTVGSLGPNGHIALMSKTLHANVLLDKQPSQSFGPSVALEGENPSLLDQAVKVGGSHQAQLVDVEEIIRAS
ncbi:hypothetical protein Godav_009720 [Gossypium davidsonii]|uniref:Uncharacterized protein n=2 Tax=Gossypium TaxID=3633 RepID=A0A7J8SFK2_GOSDV|nr:hypothetical protein [Gossypium davidsonii]MBA0659936.1 hypothetical protein [Gossypium klotzschianum]